MCHRQLDDLRVVGAVRAEGDGVQHHHLRGTGERRQRATRRNRKFWSPQPREKEERGNQPPSVLYRPSTAEAHRLLGIAKTPKAPFDRTQLLLRPQGRRCVNDVAATKNQRNKTDRSGQNDSTPKYQTNQPLSATLRSNFSLPARPGCTDQTPIPLDETIGRG